MSLDFDPQEEQVAEISLATLIDTILSLGLTGPWPAAIWFVDRLPKYTKVLDELNEALNSIATEAERPRPVEPLICGVSLRTFDPQGATEAELGCRPAFCSTPGMWLEMSDGHHLRLNEPTERE